MPPQVLTVSTGRVRPLPWRGRAIETAIDKQPTCETVEVGHLGLAGDEQGDRKHHGGPDKAVLGYPAEHYSAWAEILGAVEPPAFGENLTTTGLLESDTVVGSVLLIGSVVLQVSQPRRPCYRLAAFHNHPELAVLTQQTGRTGIYFRVLQPGRLRAGDGIRLLSQPDHGITVADMLGRRLAGALENQNNRLYGEELGRAWPQGPV
ncbi:MAG: MOSC domain-containing protein [Mycobacterium sp.]